MRRQGYHGYRGYRRRRVYIGPVEIFAGLVAVAVVGMLAFRFLSAPEETIPDGFTPAGDAVLTPPTAPSQLPRRAATPSGIDCTLTDLGEDAVYTGDLVLVNNWTFFHFPENQEAGLSCILDHKSDSYYVRDATVYLEPTALEALNTMMDAFRAQGGSKSVNVVAGHRTADYQQHLFDQSAERNGLEHAKKYVAQPGGSEHHTGLVVDLGLLSGEFMDSTGEYAWITEHCSEYGYIVRYEEDKAELTGILDEPWHFRYTGVPHAAKITELGLCLEEYTDYLKGFPFDGEHLTITCPEGEYEVWYTPGTEVYLPNTAEYQVSGNNVDGVVVTCKVK